jgi:hypothetical protein
MPTYIYETTDPAKPIRTFEVKQSLHDEPLRSDPETGEGARRVISASYNPLIRGKSVGPCRLGRFTLSLDLGRVAGHFPTVKIFGLWNHFPIWRSRRLSTWPVP